MSNNVQLLEKIQKGPIEPDLKQSEALFILQEISDKLVEAAKASSLATSLALSSHNSNEHLKKESKTKFSFLSLFKAETPQQESQVDTHDIKAIKGLYLWGDVGRGKTWLMDQFFTSVAIQNKRRIHFHAFMLQVHKKLQDLPSQPDPLALVGEQMAKEIRLLCLDEFHVMDIADAVILHGLLKALFENGVTVITTSNRHPDNLYKKGSHRERFLPAIALIKHYTHTFHLDDHVDYRLQRKRLKNIFFIPHNQETNAQLKSHFYALDKHAHSEVSTQGIIKILGRDIPTLLSDKDSVWFSFDTLCRGMRSNSDYIEIAQRYKTVILSEVPELHEGEEGPARRFLNLIDAFYDQHVYLILSSYVELDTMYTGSLLSFEFERALSRLHEMQSESWWKSYETKETKLSSIAG